MLIYDWIFQSCFIPHQCLLINYVYDLSILCLCFFVVSGVAAIPRLLTQLGPSSILELWPCSFFVLRRTKIRTLTKSTYTVELSRYYSYVFVDFPSHLQTEMISLAVGLTCSTLDRRRWYFGIICLRPLTAGNPERRYLSGSARLFRFHIEPPGVPQSRAWRISYIDCGICLHAWSPCHPMRRKRSMPQVPRVWSMHLLALGFNVVDMLTFFPLWDTNCISIDWTRL